MYTYENELPKNRNFFYGIYDFNFDKKEMSMFNNRSVMFKYLISILLLFTLIGVGHAETLTLYSGRSKSLVDPIIQQFEKDTGIEVKVSYANTTQLANKLMIEGEKASASLFWAQDAGALGAVSKKGLFAKLPESVLTKVPKTFRNSQMDYGLQQVVGRALLPIHLNAFHWKNSLRVCLI